VAADLVTRTDATHTSAYELTEKGTRLLPGLEEIRGWARDQPTASRATLSR